MSRKAKLVIMTTVAALTFATPAFAQTFAKAYGTGNAQSSYFDDQGSLHLGYPSSQEQPATSVTGLYAYAESHRKRGYGH
jgi:hypothetical protein